MYVHFSCLPYNLPLDFLSFLSLSLSTPFPLAQAVAACGDRVRPGQGLVALSWEGFKISDGDEMYHTKWQNIAGKDAVTLPMACKLLRVNTELDSPRAPACRTFHDAVEPTWLAEIEVNQADLERLVDAVPGCDDNSEGIDLNSGGVHQGLN